MTVKGTVYDLHHFLTHQTNKPMFPADQDILIFCSYKLEILSNEFNQSKS